MQKLVTFPYTKTILSERVIKKAISFTIASKTTKYLWINLTKEVKNLYTAKWDIGKRNWTGYKQAQIYPLFMD